MAPGDSSRVSVAAMSTARRRHDSLVGIGSMQLTAYRKHRVPGLARRSAGRLRGFSSPAGQCWPRDQHFHAIPGSFLRRAFAAYRAGAPTGRRARPHCEDHRRRHLHSCAAAAAECGCGGTSRRAPVYAWRSNPGRPGPLRAVPRERRERTLSNAEQHGPTEGLAGGATANAPPRIRTR